MSTFDDRKTTGVVFNIQKYSVHDGPGIRTIVFTKGCPLSCRWCSNPESQSLRPQMAFNPGRCISPAKCDFCIPSCPYGSIRAENGALSIDCSRCAECESIACAAACPAQSLIVYGKSRTVEDVLRVVAQDSIFYSRSGGGMTISGGEPLLHPEFCAELFDRLHAESIPCAVDTCGEVPWQAFETVLPHTGLFLYDLKAMDSDLHRRLTGRGNERILANLRTLDETGVPVEIRMPVVPGLNDSPEEFAAAGRFLSGLRHLTGVRLLAYHSFARSKYESVGHEVTLPDVPSPSPEHRETLAKILTGFGVNVLEV